MSNKLTPLTPTISAIKLPDGANTIGLLGKHEALGYCIGESPVGYIIDLPPAKSYTILGPVSELTPEQKAEIVGIEWLDLPKMKDFGAYDDYDAEGHLNAAGWNEPDGEANYLEAVKKFIEEIEQRFTTLLESKRVYTVNPYGEFMAEPSDEHHELSAEWSLYRDWQDAKQYVGNWILIEKIQDNNVKGV